MSYNPLRLGRAPCGKHPGLRAATDGNSIFDEGIKSSEAPTGTGNDAPQGGWALAETPCELAR